MASLPTVPFEVDNTSGSSRPLRISFVRIHFSRRKKKQL